jgi:tetratricopeptide (TPR) repeat protein
MKGDLMRIRPAGMAILSAFMLSSCVSVPAPMQALIQPVQKVRHGGDSLAAAYYRLGRVYQERGELDQALDAYTHAIARDPKAPESRIAAAVIHAQQGRLAQAKAMLLAVCTDYPSLDQALNNLGYVYYLAGDYEAATQAFRTVLARDPGSERARNNLRLAQDAGAGGAAALAAIAPVPPQAAPVTDTSAAPPVTSSASMPAAAQGPAAAGGGMQLVKVGPSVYELKLAPVEPTPRAALAALPAGPANPAVEGRLEISNGKGDTGLAKRFRDILAERGIRAGRLTNDKPFGKAVTRIEFRPGYEAAAQALHTVLGGKALLRPQARLSDPTDIRLVLGKDATVALAQLRTPDTALLAATSTSSRHPLTTTQERP